jgi:hypothetical protein
MKVEKGLFGKRNETCYFIQSIYVINFFNPDHCFS